MFSKLFIIISLASLAQGSILPRSNVIVEGTTHNMARAGAAYPGSILAGAPINNITVSASNVVQCGTATISWTGASNPVDLMIGEGGYYIGLTPISNQTALSGTSTTWKVTSSAGKDLIFQIRDVHGSVGYVQNIVVGQSGDNSCLPAGGATSSSASAAPVVVASTSAAGGGGGGAGGDGQAQTWSDPGQGGATQAVQSDYAAGTSTYIVPSASTMAFSSRSSSSARSSTTPTSSNATSSSTTPISTSSSASASSNGTAALAGANSPSASGRVSSAKPEYGRATPLILGAMAVWALVL